MKNLMGGFSAVAMVSLGVGIAFEIKPLEIAGVVLLLVSYLFYFIYLLSTKS